MKLVSPQSHLRPSFYWLIAVGFPTYGSVSFTPIRAISSTRLKHRPWVTCVSGHRHRVFGRHTSPLMGPRVSDWRSLRISDHWGPCLAQWHDPNNALNGRHFAHYGSLPVAVFWWGRPCLEARRVFSVTDEKRELRGSEVLFWFLPSRASLLIKFLFRGGRWKLARTEGNSVIVVMTLLLKFCSTEMMRFLNGVIVVSRGKLPAC